jgi:hypothetical protein
MYNNRLIANADVARGEERDDSLALNSHASTKLGTNV